MSEPQPSISNLVTLQEWINTHPGSWDGPAQPQLKFVRNTLVPLVQFSQFNTPSNQFTIEKKESSVCAVIGEHVSQSVPLPVYMLVREDIGFVLRNNFYNWKLSVVSDRPVLADFSDLFYCKPPREPDFSGDCLHSVYFEGFPPRFIYGYYETSDKRKWSAEIGSDYKLYMTMFLVLRALGHTKTLQQTTRAELRATLGP